MCGISVEFSPDGLILDHSKNIIEKQLKCMENRGPDASAIQIINPNIVMGHNRLAIIGLEKESNQPMSYDNKFHIVFNGEIYNYKDIRDELVRQGESFKTSSDTEVILIGYKLYGQKIFEKLRGMFSIIIYDGVLQKLFVTRDSFGIKPLYFYKSKNGKYSFSSSVKALKYSLSEEFHLNHQSKILFDWFGFIPEPDTVYSDLFAIEPGVNYEFSIEGIKKIDRNDKLENIFINNSILGNDYPKEYSLSESISESIGAHLVSDVPLSLFLSSGIDSNLIAHYSSKYHELNLFAQTLAVKSLTGGRFDESTLASLTAEKLDMKIHIKTANVEYIEECFENVLDVMDQPSVDGLNVFMLSKELKQHNLKVSLVGTGADEFFCGYNFYNTLPIISAIKSSKTFKAISKNLNKKFSSKRLIKLFDAILPYKDLLDSYILQRSLNPPMTLVQDYDVNEIKYAYEYIRGHISEEIATSELSKKHKLMYFDQKFYLKNQLLRDCDWASMAHSIEIRTPFVDKDLLRFILSAQVNKNKKIKKYLAKSELSYISSSFYKRKKTGFAIPTSSKKFNQNQYTQSIRDKQNLIYENF